MTRSSLVWAAAVVLLAVPAAGQDPRNYVGFYTDRYGEVSAREEPSVARAAAVFRRVLSAADKKANRFPELLVLRADGEPWALSLPDGSVVLTLGALRICFDAPSPDDGDARLAFVLGHELAHLAKDDFWHRSAFDIVKGKPGASGLGEELRETAEDARTKELQADSFGIIYAAMAGYDPTRVLGSQGGGFLDVWAAKTREGRPWDDPSPAHRPPGERAQFLRVQLQRVVDSLDYFHFGVRFFQIGSYEDALAFLSEYRREYPGREVFNDIGLAHFQLAAEALAGCDPAAAYAFKLSLAVDVTTAGGGPGLRAASGAQRGLPCGSHRRILDEQMEKAILHLRFAEEKDPFYLPAKLNLSSALILAGRSSEALGVVDSALARWPGDPGALNNKAVALYLFSKANGIDAGPRALSLLAGEHPRAEQLYNRAAILTDRGRGADAKPVWEGFLRLEARGPYAAVARERLGLPALMQTPRKSARTPVPPVRPGPVDSAARAALDGLEPRRFTFGNLAGGIYRGPRLRVLEIEPRVEIVELEPERAELAAEFRSAQGEPDAVIRTSGGETWVYGTFAADVAEGKVAKLVFF